MANQPKKYKKFVATAATATLVASAIVPVASAAGFPDVAENNSHAKAINALVEAGIIKGYEDGTFKPNGQLTRGHVVKMLGKWVEAQGFEIPADYNTVQRFDDVAVDAADQELVKYAALVKDTGVFIGSEGDLNAADSISRENMALTLDRAYKAVFGTSLVELAAGSTNKTVADLATAKEEAREEIQALVNIGISTESNFRPKETVTRGQFASFLNRTIEAEGTPSSEAGAIKSLTATKVNELTVEFDGSVDTEAAKFAVARGTSSIVVSDIEWNEDNTVAVLTVDTKFVDATYTLTVSGVAEKELTASVTTTREQATTINFLSDALVLNGVKENPKTDAGKSKATDAESQVARITFEVLNQYGEDITKSISGLSKFEVDVKGIDDNWAEVTDEGVITVWVDTDEDEGNEGTIELSYEDGDLEIEVTQEVTLSDESEPGSVEILDIYNSSDRPLTSANVEKYAKNETNNDLDDREYYLLFNVKDQYGVKLNPKDAENYKNSSATADTTLLENIRDGLRLSLSDDDIFDLDEDNVIPLNVDGTWYFAVPLEFDFKDGYVKAAGENTVTFLSKATGEESSKAIELEDSSKVEKVELLSPTEVIAGGDTVKLPVNAYDQNGELIVDAAKLNDLYDNGNANADITIDGDGGKAYDFYFIEENDQLFLEFKVVSNDDKDDEAIELEIELEVTYSDEESSIELAIEPNPYAKTLVGLTKDAETYLYQSSTQDTVATLALEDFIIEDQYGRVFDKTGFTIEAELTSANNPLVLDGNNIPDVKPVLSAKNHEIYVKLPQGVESNGSVKFTLRDDINRAGTDNDDTSKSEFTQTFRTVDADDFDSYKVKVAENVFAATGVTPRTEVEVYGVLSNGTEVQLPSGDYRIVTNSKLTTEDSTFIKAAGRPNDFDTAGNQVIPTTFDVIINEDGTRITQNIGIAEEAPKLVSVKTEDNDDITGAELTKLNISSSTYLSGSDDTITAADLLDVLYNDAVVEFKDQYGNKYNEGKDLNDEITGTRVDLVSGPDAVIGLTISDVNDAAEAFKIVNNGTESAAIQNVDKGDSFTLTLKVDDVTKTFIVRIK